MDERVHLESAAVYHMEWEAPCPINRAAADHAEDAIVLNFVAVVYLQERHFIF